MKVDPVFFSKSKEDSQVKLYTVLWYAVTSSMYVHIEYQKAYVIWCLNENFVHHKTCVVIRYVCCPFHAGIFIYSLFFSSSGNGLFSKCKEL
jgi:hypothetical protein